MAMTLLESAKYSTDELRAGVIKLIVERTPILRYLPVKRIRGNAYTYNLESSLPGIAFRGVGETYPRSTGIINSQTERLVIVGGEIAVDMFQIRTQGNKRDIIAEQYEMKARALGLVYSEKFFEGDSLANAREFDGMKSRIIGNNLITAATNGAALTLDMLDQTLDTVVGDGDNTHVFLNKTLRRKINKLGRDASNYPLIDVGSDNFGKQVTQYNGFPLHIIEREDNEATFLDFDETTGSSNVTASIYVIHFGTDQVMAIEGEGGSMTVKDFGELQAEPAQMGRLEWYTGLCILAPRAAVRLRGILNS